MGRFKADRRYLPDAQVGPWKDTEGFINVSFEGETRFRIGLDKSGTIRSPFCGSWSVSWLEPVPAMLAEHLTEQEWKDFVKSLYVWSNANLKEVRRGRYGTRIRIENAWVNDPIEHMLLCFSVIGVVAVAVGVTRLQTWSAAQIVIILLGIVVTTASVACYGHRRRNNSHRMTQSLRDHLESWGGVNWKRELEARGCALEVGTTKIWCTCWLLTTLFELTYDDLSEVTIVTPRREVKEYTGGLPQLTMKIVVPNWTHEKGECIKDRVVVKAPGDGDGYWTLNIPKGAPPGSTLVFTAPLPRRVKVIDTTGDGKLDSVAMDTNFDGNWDRVFAGTAIDTKRDGEQDSLAVDTTRDGQLDTVVALESGSAAQKKEEKKLLLTRVGSRHFYLGAAHRAVPMNLAAVRAEAVVDSTGDGRVDTLKLDTTKDGEADRAFRAQMVDTTGDGKGDLVGVDITGDGQIDALTSAGLYGRR
jgi:hypothetical protein